MEHSGFPSDETLAAFIDGRLDDVTRRRVVEHMTTCDECYAVYAAATEMQKAAGVAPPRRRTLYPRLVAAGASFGTAAILLVILWAPLRRHFEPEPAGVKSLVAATRDIPYRSMEGRLYGGFAYKPLRELERAAPRDANPQHDPLKWKLLGAAGEVGDAATKDPSAENLHALGVSHLLLGNWNEAVSSLQSAARKRPANAAYENDLATAYLARAVYSERASDYVDALESAKRAWELEQTPETAWTRAVALEHLHFEAEAREAWEAYLKLDPTSPWQAEARAHLKDLSSPSDAQLWQQKKPRLQRAALSGDAATVQRIAHEFPQEASAFADEELLLRWANGEERALDAAEAIGSLMARHGYPSIAATCSAVRMATPERREALRQAILDLGRGRALMDAGEFAAADEALERASRAGPPIAVSAALQLAACAFNQNDYEATHRHLRDAERLLPPNPGVLLARLQWLRGLTQYEMGRPDESLRSYEAALGAVRAAGHRDWEAALDALLAQNCERLGDANRAWYYRMEAFRLAARVDRPRRLQYVLIESAVSAVKQQRLALADVVTRRTLLLAQRGGFLADAHIWRARYLSNAGPEALIELRRARIAAAAIPDEDARGRAIANIDMAAGDLLADTRPAESIRRFSEALRFVDARGNHLLRAEVFAARAHAYEVAGRPALAASDRMHGIEEIEAQREGITDDRLRAAFITVARRLYTEAIDLAAASGDYARAFDFAERSRTTTAGVAPAESMERLRRVLPGGVALVEYSSLPHRTVAWIVRREGMTATTLPANGEAISAAAERFVAARSNQHSFDAAAAELHSYLIAPLRSRIAGAHTIVFVPDPSWTRFPFAALRDPDSGRMLIDDAEVTTARSASRVIASIEAAARRPASDRMLICTDPDDPAAPRLAAARREGDAISHTFPGATVITGPAATREEFLAKARAATIIHFAGHARSSGRDDDFSALMFSSRGGGDSGALYAWEIRKLALPRARLVVLAACSTDAVSDAFLAAGVPSAIATLWNIADARGDVMTEMYRRIHDGDSPSHALRVAQLAVAHAPGSRPADWAGFELVGL